MGGKKHVWSKERRQKHGYKGGRVSKRAWNRHLYVNPTTRDGEQLWVYASLDWGEKTCFLYKADNWFWGGQNTDAFVCNCSWMQSMCMYLSAIQGVTKFKPNRNCCVNAISRCLIWSVFCFWLICNSAVSIEHFNSDTYMNILNCICIALHSKPMQTLQFHQLNLKCSKRQNNNQKLQNE